MFGDITVQTLKFWKGLDGDLTRPSHLPVLIPLKFNHRAVSQFLWPTKDSMKIHAIVQAESFKRSTESRLALYSHLIIDCKVPKQQPFKNIHFLDYLVNMNLYTPLRLCKRNEGNLQRKRMKNVYIINCIYPKVFVCDNKFFQIRSHSQHEKKLSEKNITKNLALHNQELWGLQFHIWALFRLFPSASLLVAHL